MTLLLLRILHLASSLMPTPYTRYRRMSGSQQLIGCYFLFTSSVRFGAIPALFVT